MKAIKKIFILLVFLFAMGTVVNAQNSSDKAVKKSEQMKAKKADETLKQYQKAIKRHTKDQTKDTRKRMRQSRRKSNENNPNHKDFFLKRWFSHSKQK